MGLVLEGVLNMPYPDDPAELDILTWVQARSAMREAWAEIERLRAEVDALKQQARPILTEAEDEAGTRAMVDLELRGGVW